MERVDRELLLDMGVNSGGKMAFKFGICIVSQMTQQSVIKPSDISDMISVHNCQFRSLSKIVI